MIYVFVQLLHQLGRANKVQYNTIAVIPTVIPLECYILVYTFDTGRLTFVYGRLTGYYVHVNLAF